MGRKQSTGESWEPKAKGGGEEFRFGTLGGCTPYFFSEECNLLMSLRLCVLWFLESTNYCMHGGYGARKLRCIFALGSRGCATELIEKPPARCRRYRQRLSETLLGIADLLSPRASFANLFG